MSEKLKNVMSIVLIIVMVLTLLSGYFISTAEGQSSASWDVSTQTEWEDATDTHDDTQIDNDQLKLAEEYALDFDGNDDYVEVADDSSLDITDELTILMWIKPNGTLKIYERFITKKYDEAWTLTSDDKEDSVKWGLYGIVVDGIRQDILSNYDIIPDEWQLIGFRTDGDTVEFVQNNKDLDSHNLDPTGDIGTSTEPIRIGYHITRNDRGFSGRIDDVRIYDRGLSEAEIQDIYENRYKELGDEVMHIKMNEGAGGTASDSSGNENDGTIEGATWTDISPDTGLWTSDVWDDGFTDESIFKSFSTSVATLSSGASAYVQLIVYDSDGSTKKDESLWKTLSEGSNNISFDVQDGYYWQLKYNLTAGSTPEVDSFTLETEPANDPPDEPSNPSPSDGASNVATDTNLSVDVSDPDGDDMSVSFYWDNDTFIETVTDVSSGSTAETSSLNLDYGTTYSWYAVADDGTDTNFSSTWSFTTNKEPTADFTHDGPKLTNEDVNFNASNSSDDGMIESYEWDWDDDGTYEDTGETQTHSWSDDGTYTVTLKVTDDNGLTDTTSKDIIIENRDPTAQIQHSPISPELDENVTFNASDSDDPDGTIESYEWDWDDDGSYEKTEETITENYSSYGSYDVILRVTDDDGATDTSTVIVEVVNEAPTAKFDYEPEEVKEDDKITFNASESYDSDGIETFKWVIIDSDKTYRKEGEVIEHEFSKKGTYEVILEVEDEYGKSDETEQTVHVEDKVSKDVEPISVSFLLSLFAALIFISILARFIVVKL